MAVTSDQVIVKLVAETQQYQRGMQQASSAAAGFDKAAKSNAASVQAVGKASGAGRAQIQNFSYQIQDVAVQMAAGTRASVAFGQQLPQLLGGFGALGAVLGAVVAVGIPLAAMLLDTGDAAEGLSKSIERLEKSVAAYNAAAGDANASASDLAATFGAATAQAADLYERIARLQYIDSVAAVGTAISALSKNFDDLQSYINVLDTELAQFGAVSPGVEDNIAKQLADDFGLTIDQARKFNDLLTDANAATSIQERARLLNEIAVYLDNAVRSSTEGNAALSALARSAAEGALQSYELAKSGEAASLSMQEASDAASGIAASVAGIDFSGAVAGANELVGALSRGMAAISALSNQQAQAAQRAQIALDFAGDKVGAAGATGALDFNSAYDAANGMQGPLTREMQADIDARKEAYVEGAKDLARTQEQTEARLKAIAASGSGGRSGGGRKSSGGGRAAAAKEPVNIFEDAAADLQGLERQITLIGKGTEETARLRAQWELLDAAKKAGIPINDALNSQIDAQAAQVGTLTAALEAGEIAQQQFDDGVKGIATAFSNAILEGESFRDSMAGIFRQIAANILSAGIQNAITSTFAGLAGGGGFFGKLLGAAFGGTTAATPTYGGARAMGGPVTAGKSYLVGEVGPEMFVPSVSGSIVPNNKMGGSNMAYSPTFNIGGNVTPADLAAVRREAAMGFAQMRDQVPSIMSDYQKRN